MRRRAISGAALQAGCFGLILKPILPSHLLPGHGLPHNHVYAAIPAEGSLWLPTNKGLARVSLSSVKKTDANLAEVDIFDADDGLPHHEFNTLTFLKAKNGMIWLGGLNGIVAFDPKKLVLSKTADKAVIIAEFSKYDQKADSVLSFPLFKEHWPNSFHSEEKFFNVRFALLDYRNPKANQYCYKLEGFDSDWIFVGNQNTARYATGTVPFASGAPIQMAFGAPAKLPPSSWYNRCGTKRPGLWHSMHCS